MLEIYLKEGFSHITDIKAWDHMAFLLALVAGFSIKDWKKVFLLVTAFTIGHSLTLALSLLDKTILPAAVIEFLIPVTILLTALYNLRTKNLSKVNNFHYLTAAVFGLIHGLGFSNYFKALMGSNTNIVGKLFSFNIGVELGQILIVLILLFISYLAMSIIKLRASIWKNTVSIIAALVALYLIIKQWPF